MQRVKESSSKQREGNVSKCVKKGQSVLKKDPHKLSAPGHGEKDCMKGKHGHYLQHKAGAEWKICDKKNKYNQGFSSLF